MLQGKKLLSLEVWKPPPGTIFTKSKRQVETATRASFGQQATDSVSLETREKHCAPFHLSVTLSETEKGKMSCFFFLKKKYFLKIKNAPPKINK